MNPRRQGSFRYRYAIASPYLTGQKPPGIRYLANRANSAWQRFLSTRLASDSINPSGNVLDTVKSRRRLEVY